MFKSLLSASRLQHYHAAVQRLQGMHAAIGFRIGSSLAFGERTVRFTKQFNTYTYKAAKRGGVAVEAAKKDPEELVKRLGRGDLHC